MPNDLLTFLENLPAPAWSILGSIVVGLITLAGVVLTNWEHRKRLAQQFRNDNEQRKADRLWSLKKEILLRSHKEGREIFSLIPEILQGSPDDSGDRLQKIKEKVSALGESLLVLDIKAYEKASRIIEQISHVMMDMATQKVRLDVEDRIIAELSLHRDGLAKDNNPADHTERIKKLNSEIGKREIARFDMNTGIIKHLQAELSKLAVSLDAANNDIRRELNIPELPSDHMARITTDINAEGTRRVNAFLESLKSEFSASRESQAEPKV